MEENSLFNFFVVLLYFIVKFSNKFFFDVFRYCIIKWKFVVLVLEVVIKLLSGGCFWISLIDRLMLDLVLIYEDVLLYLLSGGFFVRLM